MKETELERVYLVHELPADVKKHPALEIEVVDFYDANRVDALKMRRKGDHYELIKKEDAGKNARTEHKITITKEEFATLAKAALHRHRKTRILYPLGRLTIEIDLYKDILDGYVRAEVEFKTEGEMRAFTPPAWFGPEITQWNHSIHENLGAVTFKEMAQRFAKKGIVLKRLLA